MAPTARIGRFAYAMPYRAEPTRSDRVKAIASVAAVYAVMIAAALLMPSDVPSKMKESAPTVLIDVNQLPPPEPPPETKPGKADEEEGAAGNKAEPTEIVATKPKIEVPAKPPVAAAPIAGAGSATTAGAATYGTGPGAGGSGAGRGGGSAGGGGAPAQWESGRLENRDYPRAALREGLQGTVYVRFTVQTNGRIANCRIVQSSGSPLLDDTTCRLLTKRLRFLPARDSTGRPIESEIGSNYTWGINFRR